MHEADSIIGFQMLNDPDYVKSPQTFQSAAQHINYTFNWFYADSTHTAYYNSGNNPVRADRRRRRVPGVGAGGLRVAELGPGDQHRRVHPGLRSTPTPSTRTTTSPGTTSRPRTTPRPRWGDGSVHRGNLLDDRVKKLVAAGGVTRASLVKAMAERGRSPTCAPRTSCPNLLKVINSSTVTDSTAAAAVSKLQAWLTAGGKRTETSAGSKTYADADAIRILDAWWPLLVKGDFEPGLGTGLYTAFRANLPIDESPSAATARPARTPAVPSSTAGGATSTRTSARVLGETVQGRLPQTVLRRRQPSAACRDVLISTLKTAAGKTAAQVYPGDDLCAAGDQWCADSIVQRTLGGIKHDNISWQNRPTFQQVVEFTSHR